MNKLKAYKARSSFFEVLGNGLNQVRTYVSAKLKHAEKIIKFICTCYKTL